MDGFSIDAGETPQHPNRNESYRKTIDGQIRCITADFKPKGANVAWNVHCINVFIPAWMVPPIYHSLRRENVKFIQSPDEIGARTLRPTRFEDETVARASAAGSPNTLDPMHGLRLTIREATPRTAQLCTPE